MKPGRGEGNKGAGYPHQTHLVSKSIFLCRKIPLFDWLSKISHRALFSLPLVFSRLEELLKPAESKIGREPEGFCNALSRWVAGLDLRFAGAH